nr:MAG TPA: hypothetical protein [Caudoviricetes sp.]
MNILHKSSKTKGFKHFRKIYVQMKCKHNYTVYCNGGIRIELF